MMLTLTVDVRAAAVLAILRNGAKRQRYAIANALRDTGLAIQEKQRARVRGQMTVRKESFIMREVAIIKFPSVPENRLEVRVRVGEKPRLFLSAFEEGAERRGQRALKPAGLSGVAVPVVGGARPSQAQVIPEAAWVSRLRLKVGPKGIAKGEAGAYAIPKVGVFQRVGTASRLLYVLARSVVRIPKLLGFYDTAHREAASFPRRLLKEVLATFRHNVFGGGR